MWIDQRGSEVLSQAECFRLVALAAKDGCVGHLAWSEVVDRAPVVQPVNFVYRDREVVVRLGEGHMAESVSGALVAFEVDRLEPDEGAAWSVLVRGLATLLTGIELDSPGTALPEPLVPEPGHHLFAIRADVVSGRRFALAEAVDRNARDGA